MTYIAEAAGLTWGASGLKVQNGLTGSALL
jgi:hypothetical protein